MFVVLSRKKSIGNSRINVALRRVFLFLFVSKYLILKEDPVDPLYRIHLWPFAL